MLSLRFCMLMGMFFSLSAPVFAFQQNDSLPSQRSLNVGVYEMPPFMMQDKNGEWHGMSVQLWRQVADELHVDFTFEKTPKDSLIARISDKTLHLAICAQTNHNDEQQVDFSQVYYASSLGVAGNRTRSLTSIIKGIFTMRFLNIVLWLSVILLIVGLLIWLLERHKNESHFGGERTIAQGIGSGFWWAGVTMTTIGYGDKAPVTLPGRILALLWMLVAMAITASLTAAVVSVVGMGEKGTIKVPGDLRNMKVGSMEKTASADYLQQQQISFEKFNKVEDGLKAVQQREIDAFVHSTPLLRYTVKNQSKITVNIEPTESIPQYFAVALPEESPYREDINLVISKLQGSEQWKDMINQYMPKP